MVEYIIVATSLALVLFAVVGWPLPDGNGTTGTPTVYNALKGAQMGYRSSVSALPTYDPDGNFIEFCQQFPDVCN